MSFIHPTHPTKLVPVPSVNMIPERDIDKRPILECINLGINFGGLAAVENFNIALGRTEISGLIGPNGAGKTTVFNLLTKVYQPTHGTILLDGLDTHNMDTIHVNRNGIARTFQTLTAEMLANGNRLMDMNIPKGTLVMLVKRGNQFIIPNGQVELQEGDKLLYISEKKDE